MRKQPPIDEQYDYNGDELQQLRNRIKANTYTQEDIVREAGQCKKRLEELRDRWKFLKLENRRIENVIREFEYRMRNIRR
jgi:hypothetical protein